MKRYDLIVIGAGPAGCMAAADAAKRGMAVALLEKQTLPRRKTCGGGIPMVMRDYLYDLAPEAFVEADVRFMRHTWRFGEPVMSAMNPPDSEGEYSLWMVQRSLFDYALAQRAAKAGAELRDGLPVRSIEIGTDGVTIQAGGDDHNSFTAIADHVIGADGANGITARAVGLRRERALAIAVEIELPHRWGCGHPDLRPDVLHLDYGTVRHGYSWVFPKGDHLNVGAGVFHKQKAGLKSENRVRDDLHKAVYGYLDALQVPYDRELLKFYAHPLPIWNGREQVGTKDGRVLLVGDAAGLINPVFGDGIIHAVRSGLIASQAIAENAAMDYTHRIHAEFGDNFDSALKLANFFYQWTGFVYKYAVSREESTRTAVRLLCGEALFTDVGERVMNRIRAAMSGAGGKKT